MSSTPLATDWMTPFHSTACNARLADERAFMRAAGRATGFYCKSRPVLYSPSASLAYVKTPKSASLAIQDLFQRQFPDYRWADAHEVLPNSTFMFTFVREPLRRAMSAYAEIDVAYALRASPEARNAMRTVFQYISRRASEKEVPRLLAFLDDLVGHRFGGDDRDHWMPTHAYSQVNFLCNHRIDYIGHLENQAADWAAIQRLARVPMAQTTTFPHGHDSSVLKTNATNVSATVCNRACQLKAADQRVAQTPQVLQQLCNIFASDFFCLGYPMPVSCKGWERARGTAVSNNGGGQVMALNGTLPMTLRGTAPPDAAPVYLMRTLDTTAAWRLARQPAYRNSLFLVGSALENRSNLFRLKRAENISFARAHASAPACREAASAAGMLREYDRFGWYWRANEPADDDGFALPLWPTISGDRLRPLAPLAIALPMLATPEQGSNDSSARAGVGAMRTHLEHALAEAQQLLLLHRYDRVIVVGRGVLTNVSNDNGIDTFSIAARRLIDPTAAALSNPALRAQTRPPPSGSVTHKHFLPG